MTDGNKHKILEERVPLKVNAFEIARRANSQLSPLFPYMHAGAIVPCCSQLESDGAGTTIGYFRHENTVDEVALTLGGEGRNKTGDVVVQPREHGVGGNLNRPFFALQIITQRQLEEGKQPEAMTFQCEKCSTPLLRHEFDAGAAGEGKWAGLPTIVGSNAATSAFNDSEELRTCKACGHVSKPFPLPFWGWNRYVHNAGIAEKAWRALTGSGQ